MGFLEDVRRKMEKKISLKDIQTIYMEMLKNMKMKEYSCGYCKFEGWVSETSDWTRCPNCGAL